uniref:CSON011473 protein n=1 Tax=Culicoides sonorensis TaxID=179676 RepID=A0A336LKU8_CULSO
MASKSKLLIRSHAIRESASPPPLPSNQNVEDQSKLKNDHERNTVLTHHSQDNCSLKPKEHDDSQTTNRNFGAVQKNLISKDIEKFDKSKFKTMDSSSSMEGASSGFISRENSCEQHVIDQSGVSLLQFFHETLNKNAKDRNMLLKIEKELYSLATDKTRTQVIFPPMCSYNRMLIHRVAAYFGMEHNVDATQQCVIAGVTKHTRVPDVRFKTLINDNHGEDYKKSILKRSSHSFDESKQSGLLTAQRGALNRKTKSFEERQHNYEKIKHRIFKDSGNISMEGEWSRSSSVLHDEVKSNNYGNLPDFQSEVLDLLEVKRNEIFSSQGYEKNLEEKCAKYGALWAVTDIALVPKGSILIDPQTLKPIVNPDDTIYTYDPENFPPNSKKYQGPIVKVNDVKITVTDELSVNTNVDENKAGKVLEYVHNFQNDSKNSFSTSNYKDRLVNLPLHENLKNKDKLFNVQHSSQIKSYYQQPTNVLSDKHQFEQQSQISLNYPYTYTLTNNNSANYWAPNLPLRIPRQELRMPVSIHASFLPSNHANSSLRIGTNMDIASTIQSPQNVSRLPYCSYTQGAFVPTDYQQNATPAVINVYGTLNNHNILEENQIKFSNSVKQIYNETPYSPCFCSKTKDSLQAKSNDESPPFVTEKAKNATKSLNNPTEKKKESITQNSSEPHSNIKQDLCHDGQLSRKENNSLDSTRNYSHNNYIQGHYYPSRKNQHVKSERFS